MEPLKYYAPSDMAEALHILAENKENATVLAGGTDLVPKINNYKLKPETLIYIGKIDSAYISQEADKVIIGSGATWSKLISDPIICAKLPVLAEAASQGSCIAVRNSATIGGNLANASPAADLATPLMVLDAQLVLQSAQGKRVVAIDQFFTGPGQTVLQKDELIAEIQVPIKTGKSCFLKIGRRKALIISVFNVAVHLNLVDQKVDDCRIALGSVAPTPIRCKKAEQSMIGQEIAPDLISGCAAAAIQEASPIDDVRASAWYRMTAGESLIKRALAKAADMEVEV